MSKKIFFRILLILTLSSVILYNVLASNTSDLSCSEWIPDNNTIYKNKVLNCSTKIWVNFKALEWASVEVKWDLKLDSNIKIDWNLIVHGNLTVKSTLNIWWNLIVNWNITWENASILVKWYINSKNIEIWKNIWTQALVSTWYVSVWDDSIIVRWLITKWYLKTWNNFRLNGISKIKWDFTTWNNFKWSGIIYVYWDFTWIKNYNFTWEKLKVTNDFRIGTNWTNKWRIYLFWKKVKSSGYIEENTSLDYLIWEIDPLLKITLNSKEFILIKNRAVLSDRAIYYYKIDATTLNNEIKNLKNYNTSWKNNTQINNKTYELNKLKTQIINEYTSLFDYLDDYIENDSFDINKYNYIKEYRLNDIEIFLNNLYWDKNSIKINKITKKVESNTVIIKDWVDIDDDEIIDNETWNDDTREDEEDEIPETTEEKAIKDRTQLLMLREELISKLSGSMMNKLDKVINDIENSDAKYSYPRILDRIDQMIEDNEYKTTIEKEILKWIKSYLERDLDERDLIEKVFLSY